MSQPRIDVRLLRESALKIIRCQEISCTECAEDAREIRGELDDRDDGATVLVALTPREAEFLVASLKTLGVGQYGLFREEHPGASALEEISAAIRGVVVYQ